MGIFIGEKERKDSESTCYMEFQRGEYKDKCWLEDSLNISEGNWNDYELSDLMDKVIPSFDYYGITIINKEDWLQIQAAADENDNWKTVIDEITPWVEQSLDEYGVFTIVGM
ncbi:MAG: hypothetical protein K6A23_10825 [Butyrivibrio sp.]|nr:hypothetical protein [Butyrivibrio sp.]